ncbi:MAG: TrmJ/YjtD family RNA methyltransferase [archaeon]
MLTVVMIRTQSPGNIGFMARAMANFDLNSLVLVDPLCNHLDDEALKFGMHAKNIIIKANVKPYAYLKILKKDYDYAVATTAALGTDYNIPRTPLLPEEFAKKIDPKLNIALVFGNEADGLRNDEIKCCSMIVTIPTSKTYRAMNISHAGAILFYEIYKKMGTNKITNHIIRASPKEIEIMEQTMDLILDSLDFATEQKRQTQKITWKKLMEQSMISKREAFVIIGALRKLKDNI